MNYNALKKLAMMDSKRISCCRIMEHTSDAITFEVDGNLPPACDVLNTYNSTEIIQSFLESEQISDELGNVVACSFKNDKLVDFGGDVLFKCIMECYGQHRPLVLSPDMLWLIIIQRLSKHINENPELYRNKIVSHDGQKEISVIAKKDILHTKTDWNKILDGFFVGIDKNTKDNIASRIIADFSTTNTNERIASIATLMNGVQSYFRYRVSHFICGIPSITLNGTPKDWKNLLEKTTILNEFGLSEWYEWLVSIIKEFVRASEGYPHRSFWQKMVRIRTPKHFSTHRGCVPEWVPVDGWCVALFPYIDEDYETGNNKICYDKAYSTQKMDPELIRVGFKYEEKLNDITIKTFPMELWTGFVGVSENPITHALTPKIGWFVRQSNEEVESLYGLKEANRMGGINLTINDVPEILNSIDEFSSLWLNFIDKVHLPDWLFEKKIGALHITGKIDKEYKQFIKSKIKKVYFYKN